MESRKSMNTSLTKQGKKPMTAQSIHCQVSTHVHLV
jgi:hypothetical protein